MVQDEKEILKTTPADRLVLTILYQITVTSQATTVGEFAEIYTLERVCIPIRIPYLFVSKLGTQHVFLASGSRFYNRASVTRLFSSHLFFSCLPVPDRITVSSNILSSFLSL